MFLDWGHFSWPIPLKVKWLFMLASFLEPPLCNILRIFNNLAGFPGGFRGAPAWRTQANRFEGARGSQARRLSQLLIQGDIRAPSDT